MSFACQAKHWRFFFSFSKVGFDYNTFKWNAKNQTLGWNICLASPTAAVKIKENKQTMTQHSEHSLFFVNFNVSIGGSCSIMNLYGSKTPLLFFPET